MHFPFPLNAMCVFMDMDKLLGGDFASGLANMKALVESHGGGVSGSTGMEVKEVDYPGHIYEGIRKTVSTANMSEMGKVFMDSKVLLGKDITGKVNGPSAGLYYTWDTVKKESDMAAVFPVSDSSKPVKGAVFLSVPASRAVMAVLKGSYAKEMEAHAAISKYMAAKGMVHGVVIEEYIAGPGTEPDTSKWITNIYYTIK